MHAQICKITGIKAEVATMQIQQRGWMSLKAKKKARRAAENQEEQTRMCGRHAASQHHNALGEPTFRHTQKRAYMFL